MNLLEQIKKDRQIARVDRNPISSILLTTLVGEIENIAKRQGVVADNTLIQPIISKFIKNNSETISLTKCSEVKASLEIENEILEKYLPKQLTEQEIKDILITGEFSNIGQCMGFLSKNFSGLYDGKLASKVAKEILS